MLEITYRGIVFNVDYEVEPATPDSWDMLTPGTGENVRLTEIYHNDTDFYEFITDKMRDEIEELIAEKI